MWNSSHLLGRLLCGIYCGRRKSVTMSAPDNRMESYLQKTLKKIKNAAPRKLKDLREMCDDLCGKESSSMNIIVSAL